MSIAVLSEVWDKSASAGGELLVLLAVADNADNTGYAFPSVDHIAAKARLKKRQVLRVLDALEARGEVEVWKYRHDGKGPQRNAYQVLVGRYAAHRGAEPADLAADARKEVVGRRDGCQNDTDPQVSPTTPTQVSPETPVAGAILLNEPSVGTEEPPYGPPSNRPRSVDRRPVTDAEYELAAAALDAFNAAAGTRYASRDFIAKVVMRSREHPDLDAAAHADVVRRAFQSPWWRDAPTPSVVWGNAGVFERCLHAGAAPRAASLTPDEAAAYMDGWGPGTAHETIESWRARG